MKAFPAIPLLIAVATACGCSLRKRSSPAVSAADDAPWEALRAARNDLRKYEQLYGSLPPDNPAHDFRDLQKKLPGMSRTEVTRLLGKPHHLYIAGGVECWDYLNICYAPHAGRAVERLGVWWEKDKVSSLTAAF